MDVRAGGKGSAWKLCIGLAVVCGVLVFTAGFLHRNAVASAIDAQEAKSTAYISGKLTDAVGGHKPTKQLTDRETESLLKDADVPAGTSVGIYTLAGSPVFASDRAGAGGGDRAAITSAAAGDVTRVISGTDLSVYAPIQDKGKAIAVAVVVRDIESVRAEAGGPLDALRLPLVAIGVLLLVGGLVLMVRGGSTPPAPVAAAAAPAKQKDKRKAEAPAKGRVSGFESAPAIVSEARPTSAPAEPVGSEPEVLAPPVPTEEPSRSRTGLRLGRKSPKTTASQDMSDDAAKEPKVKRSLFGRSSGSAEAVAVSAEPAATTPGREVAIREALEEQLEQLRTRIHTQEEAANAANRELQAQLDAAIRRAEEAEARATGPVVPTLTGPPEPDMAERMRSLEAELSRTKNVAAEAMAHADELQRAVDAVPQAGAEATTVVDASAELDEMRLRLAAAEQRAEDAQRLSSEAEQRAASNESVRGELEVRVAQMGAKAGELEQKATELETRLREANAGGDAVRAEIATLTASLAASSARVEELEASASAAPSQDEVEATSAEIARLRAELANQMERAQSAEARVTTLEADVLAAEHGVEQLTDDNSDEGPTETKAPEAHVEPEPSPSRTPWVAPASNVLESTPEPEPSPEPVMSAPAPVVAPPATANAWAARSERELESSPEPKPTRAEIVEQEEDATPVRSPIASTESLSSWVPSTATTEPEPAPEPTPEPESESTRADTVEQEEDVKPAPSSIVAAAPANVWVAPTATTVASTPEPEPEVSTSEPESVLDGSPSAAPAEPGGDGFSAVFAAAFVNEEATSKSETSDDRDEPVREQISAPVPSEQVVSHPSAPEAGRYGDVWSAAPEPSAEPEQAAEEPAAQATPTITSSLDDEPPTETDSMSVDDDLWALRARLAHAADDNESQDAASEGPRWS